MDAVCLGMLTSSCATKKSARHRRQLLSCIGDEAEPDDRGVATQACCLVKHTDIHQKSEKGCACGA